ncbi:MAG: UvrB/UvrC motif-containing protein [Clostridia bacterium]|nr:UvrB/UvrC motif-containing protein [Clostridia bacterium]
MLCEKCKKNNATFFFEENINGKKRSFSLCSECAEELKKSGEISAPSSFLDPFSSPFYSLHDNLFGSLFGTASKNPMLSQKKTCPGCGSTFNDFRANGKAGCAECYSTFSDELDGTIRQIHGAASHSGRTPGKEKEKHAKENELKNLKKELKACIEREEFEKAVGLRDRIKELESGKGGDI